MKVSIIDATSRPLDVISECAGISYGKDDFSMKRINHCMSNNHMSVFENAVVTFRIEGISRACSHQLVRHRMASYVQKSQRYTKIDSGSDWYVIPPEIEENEKALVDFKDAMFSAANKYTIMINDFGMRPEDARFVLPEATKTDLTVTMNIRQLFHFLDLRLDKHAQWEIRQLAEHIKHALYSYNEQWQTIMIMYDDVYPHSIV